MQKLLEGTIGMGKVRSRFMVACGDRNTGDQIILRDFDSVSEAFPAALELLSAQDVVEIQEEVSPNEWVTVVRLTKGNTGR